MYGIELELILAIAFGLVGLIGTIFGALSVFAAKQDKKINKYLFEIAEKNLDKSIATEELAAQRDKISKLRSQIEHDVPIEARKAVLKDRLNDHISYLAKTKEDVETIRQELTLLDESCEIDQSLMSFIEAEVTPKYVLQARQESLKNYLTMSTTATAIVATIVPDGIRLFLVMPLIAISTFFLISMLRIHWSTQDSLRFATLRYGPIILALVSLLTFLASIGFGFGAANSMYQGDITVFSVLSIVSIVATFTLAAFAYQLRRKYSQQKTSKM